MYWYSVCALGFSLLLVGASVAQHPEHVAVVDAGLVQGDARLTLSGSSPRLEMAVLGQSRQYRQEQARLRLAQFFRNYPPGTFLWTFQERDEVEWFATGRYKVETSGEDLRVYAHWTLAEGEWRLNNIHVFR